MRYEKSAIVLRIALDMQGSALGLSLEDIRRRYADRALSRRTAERLRDAVESLFPQIERANPGEVPKRWRLPGGTLGALAGVSADELADLTTSISVLRRENMNAQALSLERILSKIQALMKRAAKARVEPDLEALIEAEGLATRPGPRPTIDLSILGRLREAIITRRKVRLHYTYRGSGKRGYQVVQPYGFLYGKRHYLVAWSEVDRAKDFRSFALSNVERVELLVQTFSRKRGFSIQKYAERSFGVFQEEPVDVVWKFSPKAAPDASEFLFHPNQVLEPQSDGSLIVRFRAGGLLEMSWHLFTWGEEVEIIKPRRLATLLGEHCRAQLQRHEGDGARLSGKIRRLHEGQPCEEHQQKNGRHRHAEGKEQPE
jgi:predicted DNA-binding transcriptional regulator YafY